MKGLVDCFPRDRWYLSCECGELLARRRPDKGISFKAEKKFSPDGSDKIIVRCKGCRREKEVPITLIR
jgi:hypothetical protein